MLEVQQRTTGTRYTTTVALLTMAFVFSPAVLLVSRPVGYLSVLLAIACSAFCVALAWIKWKRSSRLTIPSITIQEARSK